MRTETQNIIAAIEKSIRLVSQRMDYDTATYRLEEFNARVEDPTLWNDPDAAQKLMRDRQVLVDKISNVQSLERDLRDNIDLIEMGEAEGDEGIVSEAEEALKALRGKAAQQEIEALLDGEADGNDTFLEINAGAGGTESCDWANMLPGCMSAGPKPRAMQSNCSPKHRAKKPASNPPLTRFPAITPMAG